MTITNTRADDVTHALVLTLKAIARNQARSHARRYRRWQREQWLCPEHNGDVEEDWLEREPCPNAHRAFDDADVRLMIEQLPSPEHEVLFDLIVLGWSQAEVARQLRLTPRRLRQIRQRGLDTLRKGWLEP
ncbi:sigma-70 family RNA polymerase sigma factor [Alicyclobacillus sendaiensis]|uniref:Sigma-70 family RNA polymerase sigma factor n=1 Tax=Alicyclobacillus sendaiensis PA2 TaxID=3029425 RepID=A0ABT6XTZ3_ALISE|nr:sigma-70 family RNA polymerase sigma factor [Alicyclobacillus sendaiensis]MDI9258563.1 sigma-70 family RNA polymerase sigma factor [Alicyclobacillus sendaiensis PA2]